MGLGANGIDTFYAKKVYDVGKTHFVCLHVWFCSDGISRFCSSAAAAAVSLREWSAEGARARIIDGGGIAVAADE